MAVEDRVTKISVATAYQPWHQTVDNATGVDNTSVKLSVGYEVVRDTVGETPTTSTLTTFKFRRRRR